MQAPVSKSGERGQSLLEVAIALGISMIIITALTIVTLEGLRNSQFSQNLTQATGYAAEGRDIVRTMRDRSAPIYYGNTSSYTWPNFFTTYTRCTGSAGSCNFALGTVSGGNLPSCSVNSGIKVTAGNACLYFIGSGTGYEYLLNNKFTRLVRIVDCSTLVSDQTCTSGKRVSVTVSWSDGTGSHSSNLVTLLQDL